LLRGTVAFALLFGIVTLTPAELWWLGMLESRWADDPPEVLVVLAADEQGPGLIGYASFLRVHYAVRYWRTGKVRFFVISGRSIAAPMADFLYANGVPREAVRLEESSRNTWENLRNSRPIAAALPGRIGVLTSDYHSGRAERVCRKMAWNPIMVPVPDARKRWTSWPQRWPLLWDLSVETAKRWGYWWRGWI
jgi:uncharacterized SAM-binding protein YcdF (DUF218 family)